MKISIITVVLNDLNGIRSTAQSVLSQEGGDYEYVILDGESGDGTWEYIESLDFKGVKKRMHDTGIYNAMNNAVRIANGEYVLFLNAGDTFFDSNVLAKATEVIGEKDFYVGHTMEIGKTTYKGYAPEVLSLGYLMKHSVYHQSTFIRRKLLLDNPYNEMHKVVSDWEFFFERWFDGCTYGMLNFFVSNYYLGGFSYLHKNLMVKEREEVKEKMLQKGIDIICSDEASDFLGLGESLRSTIKAVFKEKEMLIVKRRKHNRIIRILVYICILLLIANIVLLIVNLHT